MNKKADIIKGYINKLEKYIDKWKPNIMYLDCTGKGETIEDVINEIQCIFCLEYPEINNVFLHENMNSIKISRILIGILKSKLCEIEEKNEDISDKHYNNEEPIIFISHNSGDKKYGDALRNFIIGLGIKENQLIYTSHPLHKVPLNNNIFDYLRKNIHQNMFMIILWSDSYLESPACLNEMGAAWILQSDYTNIYVPNFTFQNPKYEECAIDTKKMGAILDGSSHCRTNMLELKEKIETMFKLNNDEKKTFYLIDEFIKEIK